MFGDRDWVDKAAIRVVLQQLPPGTQLIHGGCKGVDTLAGEVALELGWPEPEVYEADWEEHGLAAGPIRNRKRVLSGPHLVIAFHPELEKSKGTKGCVFEANRRGVTVWLIH